jgi:hypothetical protein
MSNGMSNGYYTSDRYYTSNGYNFSGRAQSQLSAREKTIAINTAKQFRNRLTSGNPNDIYRFRIKTRSRFNATLTNLDGSVTIELLNRDRKRIPMNIRKTGNEASLQRTLDSGVYYIRVKTPKTRLRTQATTEYLLKTISKPMAAPVTRSQVDLFAKSSLPATKAFNITFDYRFDTKGWFTPERRAALESAARVWENIIVDEFQTTPTGTKTPFVVHPETGQYVGLDNIFVTDSPIDDLTIFVGAVDLEDGTLALAGPSGHFEDEVRFTGSKYQPWLGTITFNPSTNWFFDPSPETSNDIPKGSQDFISTTVHEIGHVLGVSRSAKAFMQWVQNDTFTGPNAVQANGGFPIPLEFGGSHIQDGHEHDGSGEALLDPATDSGNRQLPTALDIAIMADLGYKVNSKAASRNRSAQ